jgi:sulfur-oxidizing protein SoxY
MTSRRGFLVLACGALAGAARAQQQPKGAAERRKAAFEEAVRRVTGGAPVRSGRVRLEVPPLIDNGNAVPLAVAVESPMTPADHVAAIHVFNDTNPLPNVLSVRLGPRAGRARVAVRARIADSGTLLAIAQTSDGAFWSARAEVVVTLPACTEESLL